MKIRTAQLSDVSTIKALEKRSNLDEFSDTELRHGISGAVFDDSQLTALINQRAIWLIFDNVEAVGYLIMADYRFHQNSALYRALYQRYVHDNDVGFDWQNLRVCGPVWLDSQARGTGAFKQLFDKAAAAVSGDIIALVAEHNERSLKAHCQQAMMQIIDFQTLAGRDFYLLAKKG